MNTKESQAVRPELSPLLQQPSPNKVSKRLPAKGKQSLESPLVPCQIRIERIGVVRRTNTPYIVYRTQYGRCCTFVSRQYLMQSLFNLLGLKRRSPSKITGFEIENYNITAREGDKLYKLNPFELRVYLARQNQAAVDGLVLELLDGNLSVYNPSSKQQQQILPLGCTCSDRLYNQCYCKHRIAAQLSLQKLGLGSLHQYWSGDRAVKSKYESFYETA